MVVISTALIGGSAYLNLILCVQLSVVAEAVAVIGYRGFQGRE